jgi:riboflavin biosynthesis pyrimidine reductase
MSQLSEARDIYESLAFPAAPTNRPYVFINMAATIDGKILTGERDESVHDLGSAIDHELMRRIEKRADAVLIGAQTLRATPLKWNPQAPVRIVLSKSGDVPTDARFLTGGESHIAGPAGDLPFTDLADLLHQLKEKGIERLLILGGSEVNAQFLHTGLVDELFLTLAPKIKLGRDVPTYADGQPLPRELVQNYDLVEHHVVRNEIFLRYRRVNPSPG